MYGVVIVKTSALKPYNNPMETFAAFDAICTPWKVGDVPFMRQQAVLSRP
jgi:hypothetical protein